MLPYPCHGLIGQRTVKENNPIVTNNWDEGVEGVFYWEEVKREIATVASSLAMTIRLRGFRRLSPNRGWQYTNLPGVATLRPATLAAPSLVLGGLW